MPPRRAQRETIRNHYQWPMLPRRALGEMIRNHYHYQWPMLPRRTHQDTGLGERMVSANISRHGYRQDMHAGPDTGLGEHMHFKTMSHFQGEVSNSSSESVLALHYMRFITMFHSAVALDLRQDSVGYGWY